MSVNSDRIKSAPENSRTTDIYLNPAFSNSNVQELARAIGKDMAYVSRITRLTLLSPEIIHGVLTGQLDQIGVEKCKQPFPIWQPWDANGNRSKDHFPISDEILKKYGRYIDAAKEWNKKNKGKIK